MYLRKISDPQQISAPSNDLFVRVRVSWEYGEQQPDIIEFYQSGGGSPWFKTIPDHIDAIPGITDAEIQVYAPSKSSIEIHLCPRVLDDHGIPKHSQPNEQGEEVVWDNYCYPVLFVPTHLTEKPRERCRIAPKITAMEIGYGSVTVKWTNPEGYDKFLVTFAHKSTGYNPIDYTTENQEYRFEKIEAGGCWARVAGIHEGFLLSSGCSSPPSSMMETVVRQEDSYTVPKFQPGTPIASVKQRSDHSELFACRLPDGMPMGIWRDSIYWTWHPWYSHAGSFSLATDMLEPHLTALSRDDGFMDLFGVDPNGRVCLAWWNGNPWREWFILSDAEFPPGAHIAAISRNSDQMDIFAINSQGFVCSNWWNGNPWRGWFKLEGADFPPGAHIAAISRNPDQMDIFAINFQGIVCSNWWNGNPWRGWFKLEGADFPPGAHIAAISRNSDQMDIFAINSQGIVCSNWWNGNPWRGWFELEGADFPPGAPISAIASYGRMHIAAIATDGKIRTNTWYEGWEGWSEVPNPIGVTFPPYAVTKMSAHGRGGHVSLLSGHGGFDPLGVLACVATDEQMWIFGPYGWKLLE